MTTVATLSPVRSPHDAELHARPSLAQGLANTLTMARRGLIRMRRTPEQLIDVVIQPLLFTPMFAYIFGGAISGNVKDYLPVLIPGVLVQTVITTTVVTGTQLREDMNSGVFDRFRTLPIARIAPLSGALLADTVRYGIATALTFVMGYVIGFRPAGGIGMVVVAGLLVIVCAWAISWIFAFFGVIARTAGAVQGIGMAVLFPLTFLSNAYVPVDTLPSGLRWFANVNPVSHLVSAVRELANQSYFGPNVGWSLLGAGVVVAVFAPLTVRAYMRRA